MTRQTKTLSKETKRDLERNREGKLSTRQWTELILEPLSTLLLLSVPMILLVGRFGLAGRYIVLGVVLLFGVMIVLRAVRFSRVNLVYRVLYAEQSHSRWMFWRKLSLTTVGGDTIRFDHHVVRGLSLPQNEALLAYYIDVADRRILVSLIPQKHPQSSLAEPTSLFERRNGKILNT